MKHSPLLSPALALTLALGAGLLPASAQEISTPVIPARRLVVPQQPGSASAQPEPQQLTANYRIAISAAAQGRSLGEMATQTCAPFFEISGSLSQPTEQQPDDSDISLHGTLSELEGGTLKLGYRLSTNALVPNSQVGKPGTANVQTTYSGTRHQGVGMLLLKPGQSYELMQISGVTYTLSITPTETWPAAKPKATATPTRKESAEAVETKPAAPAQRERGPGPEYRKLWEELSETARAKFRNELREQFMNNSAKMQELPQEERRALMRQLLEKARAEDKAGTK